MTDPKRLLDEGADDFESSLLRAHAQDGRSDELMHRTLVAMGVGAVVGATATTAAAAGSAGAAGSLATKAMAGASSIGGLGLLKWIGIGTLCGGIGISVAVVRSTDGRNAQPASAAMPANSGEVKANGASGVETRVAAVASAQPESAPVNCAALEANPAPRDPWTHSAAAAKPPVVAEATPPPPLLAPPSARPSAESPTPAPTASSLATEIAALDRVRRALASHDGAGALRQLDSYQHEFPRGALSPEATVLRIEALVLAGDRASARALAERFLKSPSSAPHATRIRSLVGGVSIP